MRPALIGFVRWIMISVLVSGLALAAAEAIKLSGKVLEVDLQGRNLTIKDPDAGRTTVSVPESATIVLDGDDQASLDDVFEGDKVESASAKKQDGKLILIRAVIKSRPGAKED